MSKMKQPQGDLDFINNDGPNKAYDRDLNWAIYRAPVDGIYTFTLSGASDQIYVATAVNARSVKDAAEASVAKREKVRILGRFYMGGASSVVRDIGTSDVQLPSGATATKVDSIYKSKFAPGALTTFTCGAKRGTEIAFWFEDLTGQEASIGQFSLDRVSVAELKL